MHLFGIAGLLASFFLVLALTESNKTIDSVTTSPVLAHGKTMVKL